ncbi:MAG: hypothetical protein ABIO55_04135 [Ginsengibacter sp.]
MKIRGYHPNAYLIYLLKFAAVFCICYFGTLAIIGLAAPGHYYSWFIHDYFNYVSWFRAFLLNASKAVLSVFGYDTYVFGKYILKIKGGSGVRIVYMCLGYGVMSFWIAFIAANKGRLKRKLLWTSGGLLVICFINIVRICLLLVATNKHWIIPYFNHHTWFNIFAYLMIFILIYFYDRSLKIKSTAIIRKSTAFNIK